MKEVEWKISRSLVPYEQAVEFMEQRVDDIIARRKPELVWILEHEPVITAGTSAKPEDLIDKQRFSVVKTGRGGEFTWHGPGQRVVYLMLDLKSRKLHDVKKYVWALEEIIIQALAEFGVKGERREGRRGIWVVGSEKLEVRSKKFGVELSSVESKSPSISHQALNTKYQEQNIELKIAAIGIRLRKWVAYHGLAININPDLSAFNAFVPCGIKDHGVTSLVQEAARSGSHTSYDYDRIDAVLKSKIAEIILNLISNNSK